WQIVESTDTAVIQFRSGGLDAIQIGPATFALLKREDKRGNFTIYNGGPDSSTLFVTFNLNKGQRNNRPLVNSIKSRWFNTLAFRQAIAQAIDRQTLINNTLQGLGEMQNSPMSVQSPVVLNK
ncbi:MAG TPA: peptide ABC transporter substrate-binding protein, partial [Cyanobacteria bacterium UBA11049]|nr:peptide ABC transporter substrate-binding protein [Cyanobacteria bacterium UBA11049]